MMKEMSRGARPFVHGRITTSAVTPTEAELPSIEEFVASDEPPIMPARFADAADVPRAQPSQDTEQWEEQDWNGFNWGSAAALAGDPAEEARADTEWSETEWEGRGSSPSVPASSVASALDRVAQRIRTGELPVTAYAGISPEGAIAAALAALIRERR